MPITVTYSVDKDLYHSSSEKHDFSLITTEYRCGNELLVHLQIGKSLCVSLNSRLNDLLPDGIKKEQFLFKKTYSQGDSKLITRSTFDAKLSHYDMNRTEIEREILDDYDYTGKKGLPGHVQIIITESDDKTKATIEFNDVEQYENFVCPSWLIKIPTNQI